MLLITLGTIPLNAAIAIALSQNVMSEISQAIKNVIRGVIKVTTMRNQRKVRSSSMSQNEIKNRKEAACEFNMGAEQVKLKELNRAQINAIRLNVKDFLPQKFEGDHGQFKSWADEVMFFLSIEEPRLTNILKRLQTIRQPITDANVIGGYTLEAESDSSLSARSSYTGYCQGQKSLIHTACGYVAWRQLNIQYYGGSVARQYTNLRLILSPTWGNHSSAGKMLKHCTQWFQMIQEHEPTHKAKISEDFKIASERKPKESQRAPLFRAKEKERKAKANSFRSSCEVRARISRHQPSQYHTQYQQPS
eukprot:6463172-Amphidinium_carterae.2